MPLGNFTPGHPSQHNFMMDCLLTEEETVLGGAVISEKELSEERSSLFIPCDSRAKREGGSGDEVLSSLHGSPRNVLSVVGIGFGNCCTHS